jgi:lysophospholipase L1-like esterase
VPLISDYMAVSPALLSDPVCGWRRMIRIDTPGGDIGEAIRAANELLPAKLVYAEGDSWFDRPTTSPNTGGSLLEAIRTPYLTAVVDVSGVGEEVRDMVRGHRARQTQSMFRRFSFDAILLSAGGNDLKNVFADLFAARALASDGFTSRFQPDQLGMLAQPDRYTDLFDEVIRNIGRFIDLREAARDGMTRRAPIFVHGYDYLQPRPAGSRVFSDSRIGGGPWLHPSMKAAGLSDAQMRSTVDVVVDELNRQLQRVIAPLPHVHLIDQRGLLMPALPGASGPDGDWTDEIHPSRQGFNRLARSRWDVALSSALGWCPGSGDLVPALVPVNRSTAHAPAGGAIV